MACLLLFYYCKAWVSWCEIVAKTSCFRIGKVKNWQQNPVRSDKWEKEMPEVFRVSRKRQTVRRRDASYLSPSLWEV